LYDIYTGSSWRSPNRTLIWSYTDFDDGTTGNFTHTCYYLLKPYGNTLDARMTVYNCSSVYDKVFKGLEFDAVLYDNTAPYVKESYLDDSSLAETGKLRLIVRYSEPVYENEKNSVSVKLGNSSTYHSFDYVGGNFTDTHYYEFDTNAGQPIFRANVSTYSISIGSTVKDLAYILNANKAVKNNSLDDTRTSSAKKKIISRTGNNINYRVPDLSIELEDSVYKDTKYRTDYNGYVYLGTTDPDNPNLTSGVTDGELYYVWNTNDTMIKDASKFESRVDYSGGEPVSVTLRGKTVKNLAGVKEFIGGEWIMEYKATSFVVDGVKYIIDDYDRNTGVNRFRAEGMTNSHEFDGITAYSCTMDNKIFTFNGATVTIERAGEYYLHVYGNSEYNLKSYATFGPYKIDGAAPVIDVNILDENNTMRVKTFDMTFTDRPDDASGIPGNASGCRDLVINVRRLTENGTYENYSANIIKDGSVTTKYRNVFKKNISGVWNYYSSVNDLDDTEEKLDPLIYGLMGGTRETFEISFT
nr:hypothetical protein [Clostridia bacterium]